MQENQRVSEMVVEVLARQASGHAKRTGEPLEDALKAVLDTEAGRQLGELREGAHREERVHSSGRRILRGSEPRSVSEPDERSVAESNKNSVAKPDSPLGRSLSRRSGGSWSCARAASSPECWENRCRGSHRRWCCNWPPRTASRQRKG